MTEQEFRNAIKAHIASNPGIKGMELIPAMINEETLGFRLGKHHRGYGCHRRDTRGRIHRARYALAHQVKVPRIITHKDPMTRYLILLFAAVAVFIGCSSTPASIPNPCAHCQASNATRKTPRRPPLW